MTVAHNVVDLLVEALRDATGHCPRDQSVAMMKIAANTAIQIRPFDIPILFERLMNMSGTLGSDDRDVLCVALACTFISGQRQAGAYDGIYDRLPSRRYKPQDSHSDL